MTADKQLKAYIDRVLRLKEEQDTIGDDIREIYAEAKGEGYDKAIMGKVVAHLRRELKKGSGAVDEAEIVFDTYLTAYRRASGTPVATHTHEEEFDPITGEFTTRSPRKAAEAVSERTAVQVEADVSAEATIEGQPSVTVATSAESAGEAASSDLPTNSNTDAAISRPVIASLGRPEIENRSDEEAPEADASGGMQDECAIHPATPIASASQGEAEAPSLEGVNPVDEGGLDANAGGEDALIDENCDQPSNTVGERINVSPSDGITYETAPKVGMKYLSYAHCFPELTKAEYQCLAGDITLNGVQEPIVRMGDIIVDGWNRYNAARSLGIEYPVREYDGDDVLLDVIRWQRAARNWTPQQQRKIASSLSKVVPHRSNDIWQAFDQEPALQKEEVAA